MTKCNFQGRDNEATVCDYEYTQGFVTMIFPTAQLNSFTRYGHTNAEYYVTVAGTRISLYWDSPSEAWTDAASRISQQLIAPEPASLLEI